MFSFSSQKAQVKPKALSPTLEELKCDKTSLKMVWFVSGDGQKSNVDTVKHDGPLVGETDVSVGVLDCIC